MVQCSMHKSKAIELLGGNTTAAAKAIGISYQAVNQWPDDLPPRIADRVDAAVARSSLQGKATQSLVQAPLSMKCYLQHSQIPQK